MGLADRGRFQSFYDFPAKHWKHVQSSNPIESTFATVRLRTTKTKGCMSRNTALAMVFKLLLRRQEKMAQARWVKQPRRGHQRSDIQRDFLV